MPKVLLLLTLVLLTVVLTGCWNRIELNELSITSATAYDLEGEDWVISYQVIIPSAISSGSGSGGSSSSQSPITVFSAKGHTIRDAVNQSSIENPRGLFFAHNNVLVVSAEVARHGLTPILELYLRNPDSRETVNIVITDGKARTVLEQLMHSEKIPGQGIREIIVNESKNASMLPNVMMYKLAMSLTAEAKSAVIPEIVLSGQEATDTLDTLKRTYVHSKLKMGRLGVIKDDKLVGWLKRQEGLGVMLITNEMKFGTIPFSCKASNESNPKEMQSSFRIMKASSKLRPRQEGDHFKMKMDIKVSGSLMESDCGADLNKPDVIRMLEKQLQQEFVKIIHQTWQASQKLHTDVLGFAGLIHRKYPKEWKKLSKNWDEHFVNMQIEPSVSVSIERIGLTNRAFSTSEPEGR